MEGIGRDRGVGMDTWRENGYSERGDGMDARRERMNTWREGMEWRDGMEWKHGEMGWIHGERVKNGYRKRWDGMDMKREEMEWIHEERGDGIET